MSYGDARLELWENLCTCRGKFKSPDVRMCSCLASHEAGLSCAECNAGVMLIKTSYRGNIFWGCSQYKKRGCKNTMRFGPPHDRDAARRLEHIKSSKRKRLEEEEERRARMIVDEHEQEWRAECQCDGAKHLNTFECFMRSSGGCGFLPLCPRVCGGSLFLKNGRYGQYWQCSNKKNGCSYSKSYEPHDESAGKKRKTKKQKPQSDVTNTTTPSATIKAAPIPSTITPDQKDVTDTKLPALATPMKEEPIEVLKTPARPSTDDQKAPSVEKPAAPPNKESSAQVDASSTPSRKPQLASKILSPCKNPENEPLFHEFMELAQLYTLEQNNNAVATYGKVAGAIQTLDFKVTKENAKGLGKKGKTKVAHVGKASADKMFEFLTTGKIVKLEEKRAALHEKHLI